MKKLILLLFIFSLFNSISHAQVTRGASPAEIYLSNFWYYVNATSHYAILHSTDNGEHLSIKYSNTGSYSPGEMEIGTVLGDAAPGALYNSRYSYPDLWFSPDYGETFTTYFHELDSLFTSVGPIQKSGFKHSAFPNPFSEIVTFNFDLPRNCSNPELNIYNLQGDKIKNFQISGGTALRWDGKDKNGNTIPCGIYFYSIQGNGMASGFNKLVFIR